ncbi:MAG: isoprenylcysteine carboxylmethyltransferase family protein [Gammaproteobacteria bacterium]|nr:isoprenylcysteine carboxylmethyltransferase family protein [Gammaproteobacteria bacterium]
MAQLDHKIPPPVVAASAAMVMWLLAPTGPVIPADDTLRDAFAGVLVAIGICFDILGLLAFRAVHTTINPLRPERATALVVTGVYTLTRNPMYVGLLFMLLGWAVHLSAWLTFAGPVIYMIYITRFQIIPEERILGRVFGERYTQYTRRVRRWL